MMEPTEQAAPDAGMQESQSGDESFSAFLPKEIAAGKKFKAGEEIVLTVKAVDPDTGELEVQYAKPEEADQSPMEKMNAMQEGANNGY
jgi:hypothetical protein